MEDGYCPNPTVFVEYGRESKVLDVNGEPINVRTKRKVGFDLSKK